MAIQQMAKKLKLLQETSFSHQGTIAIININLAILSVRGFCTEIIKIADTFIIFIRNVLSTIDRSDVPPFCYITIEHTVHYHATQVILICCITIITYNTTFISTALNICIAETIDDTGIAIVICGSGITILA